MIKEYLVLTAVMGVFTLSSIGFVKDMAQQQLCSQFENSAAHEFCKKESK
jgi:hypothetical protein